MWRPITDILRDIKNGRLVNELSAALAEVGIAVGETNKEGRLQINVILKPGEGNERKLDVTFSVKKPYRDIPQSIFFADAEGNLLRSDPAQREMEFTEVGRQHG
jgi:hypothetical protein